MKKFTLLSLIISLTSTFAMAQELLPKWKEGELDIHLISTGRGNCSFFILPDGTKMLVDAGDFNPDDLNSRNAPMFAPPQLPNPSFTAGRAIINYIHKATGENQPTINYALITHFHGDHYGSVREGQAKSSKGDYILTGLTEVGEYLKIEKIIDRTYPNLFLPVDLLNDSTANTGVEVKSFKNYLKFIETACQKEGATAEAFKVGSIDQFSLKNKPQEYPEFSIRNIKSNNIIWTGQKENTRELFTIEQLLAKNGKYTENSLPTAFVLNYGKFRYFEGGDNYGLVDQDHEPWQDAETPISEVVGKVSAMSLCHHGNRSSANANIIKNMDPLVVVNQTWCTDHPGAEVGMRLISSNLGTHKRDIYFTYFAKETSIGIGPWFERELKSKSGHLVIRAHKDGTFRVYVLDNTKTNLVVLKKSEIYKSN